MTEIKPKYFEHPDYCIRHLEYTAIRWIVFNGSDGQLDTNFGCYPKRLYWSDYFQDHKKKEHIQIQALIVDGTFQSMQDFYKAIKQLLKPKLRGKALKDKKKRTAQEAYQREQLGDDFIDNKPLIAAAKAEAKHLNAIRADKMTVSHKAAELATQHHDGTDFSEGQMKALCDLIQHQMDKLMHPDSIEAKLIDTNNKNLWFMWGKIKRQYAVGETFAWTTVKAVEQAKCSKSDVKKIMKKLCDAGALTRTQEGIAGQSSGRANIYRREV